MYKRQVTTLVALLVCLAPTTIGALLSAIGIAGMSRLKQANVLAMSGRAIEAAGDVDTLMPVSYTHLDVYKRQGRRWSADRVPHTLRPQ